ncbi:sigma-70 family RNA polymerase sigma factor [Micromonospora sp. NPDC049891]|uniref:RNA polymerase sigma factor n=1 Tax=Micromonospora sp. NPDC049891 TaxID=3155655 RepID=UPI0033EA794B
MTKQQDDSAELIRSRQEQYFREHVSEILAAAIYRHGQHLGEDLTQQAFLRVFKSYDWQTGVPPVAYVRKALRWAFIDLCRRVKSRGEILTDEPPMPSESANWATDIDVDEEVRHAVAQLPPRQQQLIRAVYYEGKKLCEFARENHLSEKVVHNYHHLAKRALEKQLAHLVGTTGKEGRNGR